ncbi:MAG: RNA polymerase sigma factor [Kiritimatiellae bacterium]|nr:RNA polymerase sigma factor [Kiritimatiellia bacterium]MDD5519761.1 RNA polymerase sigma factor [Kiritimatiellia bacterium]
MQSIASGCRDAFSILVKRHQRTLMNFFYRMDVYNSDIDDLVQETFLRLFNYRERYRPTARFVTFLYLMARQVQIDHFRKKQRRANFLEVFKKEPSENLNQVETGASEDRKVQIMNALDTLSDEMRCVVVMNIYEGLKYKEIAEILDIPLGTVKTRMFHAFQKLRKVISHEN